MEIVLFWKRRVWWKIGTLKRPALWPPKMISTSSSPGERKITTVSPLVGNKGEIIPEFSLKIT